MGPGDVIFDFHHDIALAVQENIMHNWNGKRLAPTIPIPVSNPRLQIESSRSHTDRNTSQKKMGVLAWWAVGIFPNGNYRMYPPTC